LKRLKNFIEAQLFFSESDRDISKTEQIEFFLGRSNFIGFLCMRESLSLKKQA
jgi:hypothetical protein